MLTISERAVTMLIWTLTAMGVYFALRAAWRKCKSRPAQRDGKRSA